MRFLTYKTKKWEVTCPMKGHTVSVGDCADYCNFYEGDGQDEEYMKCGYAS